MSRWKGRAGRGRIESNHTIDIDSFVPRDEIDRRYLDHPLLTSCPIAGDGTDASCGDSETR